MSAQVEENKMNCGLGWSEQGAWGGADAGNKVGEMERAAEERAAELWRPT